MRSCIPGVGKGSWEDSGSGFQKDLGKVEHGMVEINTEACGGCADTWHTGSFLATANNLDTDPELP